MLKLKLPTNIHFIIPAYILVGCAIFGVVRYQVSHPKIQTIVVHDKVVVNPQSSSIKASQIPPQVVQTPSFTQSSNEVINGVNKIRLAHSLSPLAENQVLDKVASLKVQDICKYGYWSHDNPNGETWISFYQQAGYVFTYAGENLGEGYLTTADLLTAWTNSPEHYQNIISPNYTETGASSIVCPSYRGGTDITIVANEFGRP